MIQTSVIKKAVQEEITFICKDNEECKIVLNKPNWDITVEAFKAMYDAEGRLDLMTSGKLLFDYCVLEYSEILEGNIPLMMTVTSQLATKYLLPMEVTVKKKEEN